jgi:DMSO reductase anchor subunit
MNPALSVLLFTTLSGAGLGLLMWAGVLWALSPALIGRAPAIASLCVGGALLSTGLGFSFFHLGQPLRAWRAFSQWRTSWLSREAVVAVATLLATAICVVAVWRDHRGLAVQLAAAVLASLALLTVIATAGIYASLKPIRAWNNGFVAPFLVSAALWSGGCLLWLVIAVHGMALPPVGLLA